MTENHEYGQIQSSHHWWSGVAVLDKITWALNERTEKVAEQSGVPPYAVFQESSIEDMLLSIQLALKNLRIPMA